MTRRAVIAIDFDTTYPGQADHEARELRRNLATYGRLRNVEVTVIDPGTPGFPAATAVGPAHKKETQA